MYKVNRGLKEWQLEPNLFYLRFLEVCNTFNINTFDVEFYSQQDEDKYIIQYLLKEEIKDGTFLEIGGCDGVLFSNTKTLEDHFGFTGVLIEPQPEFYSQLVKNRPNCKCYNYAVSNTDDEEIEFIGDNAEGGIKSITNTDLSKFPEWNTYKVKNKKMHNIIEESGLKYIDFMIIDVEGSELEVLKSIDFSFPIFCIIIEAHSCEQEKNKIFGSYLKSKGFKFKERQRGNEIWLNHDYIRKQHFNTEY
jgi:FkbM family methyltransferase